MSDRTNVDVKACPETHESFRFCLKKDKAKKKKLNVILSSVVKELGPGNKDWFENATAKKIQQKKQKKEEVDGSLFTPKDKIHSYQLGSSTNSSSESSENKFYSKIQRLLTSQTSTPSQTAGWQVPVLGVSPDVVSGSAPLCKQMDIRKSLGIDMNDSMLSWTSSMATPTLMDSTFKGSPSPLVKQQKGLPRVLFSPGPSQTDEELHTLDNTSEDNTDDDDDDLPPVSSTTKKPSVVKLVSPDITVFQNINHHEMFNADSEISEHFSAANSEIKLNAKFKSSPNFGKNALKESTSIVTSNDEEYSMPLFSQDLYVDGDAEDSQKQVYLAEISTQHDQPGNDISKTTGESLEKGVSEALSDFFDPPSSAVGRRRCAPRKGKKRKLVDSLSLEVCSDNESSINVTQSKKMKMALLSCENGENYRNMAQVQNEEDENITENKITIKNEFTEENTYSASLNSCQRKHSISQEDGSSGNCSTPINTRRTLKSILSSKKKTTEGSEVKSNKKVTFCLEEKTSLKRNLTQLEDEEYVSPDIIIQTLPTDDTNSVEDFESDNNTFTRSISKQDSASHDLTSENVCIDRSPRKDFDIEFCDELFSQVSPSALNEMCSVVTLVDKSSKTQKSNLAGSEKAKPDLKLKADDKPVSVKTEVMEDVKTEDKVDVTLSLMKIKDENRVYATSPLIKSEDENKVTLHVDKKEDSLQRIDPDYSRLKCLRGSLSLKTKPKKFLYPSTNQISKSCPKSVYGFSELSEKSRRLTMDTRPLVDRDTLQGTVLVQTSATKSALEERSDKSQKQEWPDLHRKSHKNIGFKSFSSLANSRKNALVTDHSDVCNDEYISQPDVLLTKAVQVGNTEEKQRKGQPENGDVQSSEWKTPLILKVLSDSEAHVKKDSYKSQSSESEDTKIKTDISEDKKQISCECVKTEMIQKQKDSSQIILNESRKHKINHVESESSSPNMLHHTVKKTTDDRNISNLEHSDGNHEIREGSKSLAKCTGFSSASGKAMTFSEEGLHKAKQLFICVESDTGITDDSLEMERSLEDKNMFSVKEIHNKDKTKLPRRTFTNSDAAISCQGKTASAVSTQNSNIAGVNQQGAKGSVQDSCVDLEDMPENVLMSGSSPEVSKLSSFQKTFDHSEGFQTRRNEKLLKNSKLEIAISMMKFSELHSDLNAKNVAGNSVSSEAECNSGNHEQEDRSFHTCHTDIIHKGFTTAAGKHVQLSDTSLKKATALLDDVDTNYPPTSWSFPGSTEEVKDSLKDIRKVVKDDESIKENVHLTTAGMENRVDKDSLSCGKSSNEKSFCDSGKFKRAGMSGCKPKVSQVGRKGSDMEERKTLADSTIESSGRHLRLISDGGSKSELRSVDPVKKNATHILTDDKEVEVHLSTETCSDEEMVPEVCGRQKDDGKSAVELSTVSQKFQHFRDSSPEIPKALFIEMDKEMDTVSKYEVMNGKLGFTDKDGEKHRTIDSGVKKSDLLDADTSKGMKSGLEDINEVTKISTATAKRWKLSGSSLIKPVLFVGDMEKTVTPKDILDGDYSDTAELAGISTISGLGGFSTAGGKKLKLSCSSLKKAMSLVADVDGDVTDSSKRDIGDPTDKSDISIAGTATGSKSEIFSSAGEFGGFSTAAGRKLKLSDASLRKAMSLVVDVDSAMTDNSNQITGVRELERSTDLIANRDKLTEDRKVKGQRGFSMAGGLKGRNTTGELKEFSTADGLGGFSTADGLGGFSTADGLGGFSTADGLGGFSTAGGKKLKLSDSSLRKAMSIISNVDNTDNGSFHDQYEKSGSDSCGFQTAGGKQVQISEASISKGVSVIRKVDTEEGIENSALFGNNKESVEGQNRRGELVHFEEGCTSTMLDILNPKKRSGSTIIKDKSLQTNINRKSSSRFPPGANIPKGFRPFKPPKITKKPNIAKSNDRHCVDMSNKVIDKTLTVISKSDDVPFSSSEDKCGGISGTTTFDTDAGKDISHLSKKDGVEIQKINLGAIDGCCSSVLQISQENKVEPQKDSISTVGNSRNISPEFKAQNADQDIDSSIMDELFSGELESSQHFSPGSGKVLRSQKYSTTPENQDQGLGILPSSILNTQEQRSDVLLSLTSGNQDQELQILPSSSSGNQDQRPGSLQMLKLGSQDKGSEVQPSLELGNQDQGLEVQTSLKPGNQDHGSEVQPSLEPGNQEQEPEVQSSLEPGNQEQEPEVQPSLEPGNQEQEPKVQPSLEPGNQEQGSEVQTSLKPGNQDQGSEVQPSLEPCNQDQEPEVQPSLEPCNQDQEPEVQPSLEPGNQEQEPEVQPSLKPGNQDQGPEVQHSFRHGSQDHRLNLQSSLSSCNQGPEVLPSLLPGNKDQGPEVLPSLLPGNKDQGPEVLPSLLPGNKNQGPEVLPSLLPGNKDQGPEVPPSLLPGNKNQRPEVLPSEEYEHFLDMEDMVMCDNSTAQVKTQLPVKHTVFSVFQSASGKCVGFSEEANQQVKQPKTIGVSTETTEEHSQKEHSKQQTGDTGFQSSIKTHSVSKVVVSNEETETEDVDKNVDSEGLRCVVSKEFTASDEPWKTTHLPLSSKFTNESQNTEPKKDLIKSLNQQTVELGGFQSASGKMVHISEDALIKARQSLYNWSSEINEESLHGETQTVNEGCDGQQIFPELKGFHSASGKKISVSDDALVKARQNMREWSTDINSSTPGDRKVDSKGDKSSVTTSNKDIYEDVTFSGDNSDVKEGEWTVPEFDSFHHSTGKTKPAFKKIVREEEKDVGSCLQNDHFSLQEVMNSQYDFSQDESHYDSTRVEGGDSISSKIEMTKSPCISETCDKVQTESGKYTDKSESTFINAKMDDDDDGCSLAQSTFKDDINLLENAHEHAQEIRKNVDNSPFLSASGQNVSISEKALEHARKIMDDVGNSPFLSASGKKVIVSESSLEHARKSMEDVGNSPFLSASGKKMNVSESSLEHARKSMEDVGNSLFLSASGKKVNVSESSLEHARKSMEDVQNMLFQSASGKKVNISENALEHARNALEDIGNSPLLDTSPSIRSLETKYNCGNSSLHSFKKSPSSAHSSPFQTATGNKITISESSLQHVRKTKEDHELTSCIGVRNGSCDRYPISVQQTEKLNKGPKLKYQLIKEGPTVEGKQSAPTENKITPLKQKQHGGTTRPRRQGTEGSPYMGHSDRQVFIQGMEHTLEEFCQPDDFLEEMEVTPKRRRVEVSEKAVTRRAGIVTPMKCVPEAFTRDRQGTSCSLRPYHSTSATSQESSISLNNGPQTTLRSSFSTPYKKPDTNVTGTDSNPAPSSSTQTPCKQVPKFIPKCLSVHHPDLMKSQSMASPSFNQKCPSEIQTDTKEEEKSVQTDMAELLERARKHQTELLQDKKKSKISPDPGRLYSVKQGNRRLKMRDVIKLHTRYVGRSQQHYSSLWLRDVQSTTAVQYKFHLPDFYTNFQGFVYVGDGAYLVPDDKLCAGKDEFFRAFSTLVGVDCRLISDVWFYNHYRWLVWKLAAYEVTSPQNFAGRALTPEVVMLQMKYRYDREIDNCQRSALKKIMERDDTASKRMVLCVSSINQLSQASQHDISSIQTVKGDNTVNQSVKGDNTPNQAVKGDKQALSMDKSESQTCVELTDGWYSIVARFDVPLTDLVSKHRINVGDKLCISGAELVGSQDACTPLEAPASLMLKLNANSTRPAPWDARLGYQMDPSPLCISLSGLYGDGGAVGCLDVVLARKYPQMYMEKLSEGGCVFRTGQAEDRIQHKYQQHRQDEMEKLYAKLQKEFELEDVEEKCTSNKKWTKREVELLQTGHEIYEAFSTSRQPDMIEEYLSDRQRELLMERRRQIQDEKRQKLHAEFQKTWQTTSERNVIPLMKMKFVGCSRKDMDSKASTTVTVWRPTQDMMELTEGTRYKIFGLNASLSRSRYNKCDVQLTASRQTRFKPVAIDENLLDMIYEPREVLSVQDIKRRQSLYGEADFVGMVVSVSTLDFSESGRHQDVIYAVDANSDILGIKFWGGLKSFLPEDILIEGRLFCASNLMDKSAYLSSVLPLLDASMECSVITQTSQYPAQRRALERLKSVSSDTHGFLEAAKEHLSALEKQKKENTKKFTPEKNLKKSIPDRLDSILKTSAEGTSSHSLPAQSVGEDSMQPGTSKQGHITYQAKMARLLNFGSPTPLSPLLSKTSQSVNKTFKPPLLRRKSLGPNH